MRQILLALALISSAAATEISPNRTPQAITVTSTSAQVLAAATIPRTYLSIHNASASATIACAFGATAALNTAGSYTVPPGGYLTWDPGTPPTGAMNCISSAATSPATIEAF